MGGSLGLTWNLPVERVDWVAALLEIVGGEDRMAALDEGPPDLGSGFGPVESARFEHAQELDEDGLAAVAGRARFALPYGTSAYRARTPGR